MKIVCFNFAGLRLLNLVAKATSMISAASIASSSRSMLMFLIAAGTFSHTAMAQTIVGNKDNALSKIQMCIGCHAIAGYKASFPTVYSVPKIGGQSAKYIENALQAYKKGDRSHPTMRGIAGSLTDQDMADLAAFYGAEKAKN